MATSVRKRKSTNPKDPRAPDPALAADRIHSASIHLLRGLRRTDEVSGLSAPRLSILSILVFAGPRTLGELAQLEQVRPPTMTRLVQALEEEGLVTRTWDRDDRRIARISATARGRAALMRAREARLSSLTKSLSTLDTRELRTILAAAQILEDLKVGK